jgi:polar amino acid transport system substrate-binding protein
VSHLHGRMSGCLLALVVGYLLQGCGLLYDAAQLLKPAVPDLSDELDVICRHRRLQVGIAVEPFPPFVFPVVWTEQGPRMTGLDIELVQEIAGALSKHCGGSPVTAVPNVVHFRDLFRLLSEGHLDMFVSAVGYNIAHPTATGLAFSTPYYYDAGIGAAARRPEVVEQVRTALRQPSKDGNLLAVRKKALAGLTVAAQEARSPYVYAEAELKGIRLVACDTLSAAFQFQDPPIDVILIKQPTLDFIVKRDRLDWQPLVLENGQPFLLTHELFTVVMAEASYRLQGLVNNVLFELEQSGRLAAIRRRWFDENYAYTERAMSEGLLSHAEKDIHGNEVGRCWRVSPH